MKQTMVTIDIYLKTGKVYIKCHQTGNTLECTSEKSAREIVKCLPIY